MKMTRFRNWKCEFRNDPYLPSSISCLLRVSAEAGEYATWESSGGSSHDRLLPAVRTGSGHGLRRGSPEADAPGALRLGGISRKSFPHGGRIPAKNHRTRWPAWPVAFAVHRPMGFPGRARQRPPDTRTTRLPRRPCAGAAPIFHGPVLFPPPPGARRCRLRFSSLRLTLPGQGHGAAQLVQSLAAGFAGLGIFPGRAEMLPGSRHGGFARLEEGSLLVECQPVPGSQSQAPA